MNFFCRFLASAFLVFIPAAARAAALSVSPASGSYYVGDTIIVQIMLDTQGSSTDGVDLHYLNFTAGKLEAEDSDGGMAGVQIAPGILYVNMPMNSVDNMTGKIDFSQTSSGGSSYSGSGVVATISFKALSAGTATISPDFILGMSNESNVASRGSDILTSFSGASYVITDPHPSSSGGSGSGGSGGNNGGGGSGGSNSGSGFLGVSTSSVDNIVPVTGEALAEGFGMVGGKITFGSFSGPAVTEVAIMLDNAKNRILSAADGSFSFSKVLPGKHKIVVGKVGYRGYAKEVMVATGKTVVADIYITKNPGGIYAGDIIKIADSPAVYYVGLNGKRYVFPNAKCYRTWYDNFDGVKTVSVNEISAYAIGGNITYRPGTRLVKITTAPKVYALGPGGVLHWIKTEEVARALYGNDWNRKIDNISDTFFDYTEGGPIESNIYPDGALFKYKKKNNVYLVEGGKKRLIKNSQVLRANRFFESYISEADSVVVHKDGLPLETVENKWVYFDGF